jgi:DNA repair exonuclease SbcCD nuclease subunit
MKLLLQYAIGKKEKLFALLPETKTISFRAFSDAYNLEYVDACPVEKIEEKAFYFCSKLRKLLVNANCEISGEKVFEHTTDNFASSFSRRGRIILFADIHGHIRLDFLSEKLKNLKINAEDVIIILGDAGIVWQIPMRDDVREFYSALTCDVLFLDGNHENYDILGNLKKVERYGAEVHEVLSNVFHLIRGNAYLINGKKCFVFGGAYSIKRETDSSPVQTWAEELPNAKEYKRGLDTIFENENKFDIILTHQSPKSILDEIAYNYSLNETELLDYLERIRSDVKFDHWYFGHIHKDIKKEKITGLYNNYEAIE